MNDQTSLKAAAVPPDPINKNQLDRWLWERGITNIIAGEALGCVPETVRRWRLPFGDVQRRIPDEAAMARIFEFTQGEVSPASFYQMGAPIMGVLA